MLRTVKSSKEADFICMELKKQGFLKSYVVSGSTQAVDFPSFLSDFWDYDSSPYIREKLHKNHGIHRNYVKGQKLTVEKFWKPWFSGRLLGEITRQDIEDFMDSLDSIANAKNGLSAGRKNIIIKAGTIPLRWAFSKEIIEKDIARDVTWFSGKAQERHILTPELAHAVFRVEWPDPRAKLANMLASVTGLRAGEIQGLRVQDLGKDCLYIHHSWNFRDGLKTTKNNKVRTVEVPFPALIGELLYLAKQNPHGATMDSYVFWTKKLSNKPIEAHIFLNGLRDALVKTGMGQESASMYVFHGWRHFFTSYMIGKIDKKLLKSQTGHLTDIMLAWYGDHTIEGDRDKIRNAQKEVFGELIPANSNWLNSWEMELS